MCGMETAPETKPGLVARVGVYIAISTMLIMPLAAVAGYAFVVLHFIVKYW